MDRRDVLLLMMAPAGQMAHTPVQVQKLAFLIEKTMGDKIDGTGFDFIPWHYGPFDKRVYATLEVLEADGLVAIEEGGFRVREFRLTPQGVEVGEKVRSELDPRLGDYVKTLSAWVHRQSFASLVNAIYERFPEMRVRSMFNAFEEDAR